MSDQGQLPDTMETSITTPTAHLRWITRTTPGTTSTTLQQLWQTVTQRAIGNGGLLVHDGTTFTTEWRDVPIESMP